jgi:hypothetical protein
MKNKKSPRKYEENVESNSCGKKVPERVNISAKEWSAIAKRA